MNKIVLIILASVVACAYGKSLTTGDQVPQIQLYYESLCPGCQAFIVEQLQPAYVHFAHKYFNLELIPWGHASEKTVNGTKIFTCQHGPEECYGNKVDSCVLDLYNIDQSFKYVFCTEDSDDSPDEATFKQCAKSTGLSWSDIQDCLDSGKGDELLSANGKKTALINPAFVPTIVLNGKFSQKVQDDATDDFVQFICDLSGNPPPCKA